MALTAALVTASHALAQSCEPGWLPMFGTGLAPGEIHVYSTLFADIDGPGGEGEVLVVGTARGVYVVRDEEWSLLDPGMWTASAEVYALAMFDPDGTGPEHSQLIAAGIFSNTDQPALRSIAKWNGSSWEPLGGGLVGGALSLTTFDLDGDGPQPPALIAAGSFTSAGGTPATRIAAWNGTFWTPLGGLPSQVRALATFDADGEGPLPPQLYAAGSFSFHDGTGNAYSIARWDGAAWRRLGSGLTGEVRALAVYDADGPGPDSPRLMVSGFFDQAGGTPARSIAQWNGASWSAVGVGLWGGAYALSVHDPDGSGPNLPQLIAGGNFTRLGTSSGTPANGLARWDGATWAPMGSATGHVLALTSQSSQAGTGGQTSVIAGGTLTAVDGVTTNRIARWDGTAWRAMGNTLKGITGSVFASTAWDPDGGGPLPPRLVIGGQFTSAAGVALNRIALWDGTSWTALGSGMDENVYELFACDTDGSGPGLPRLFASGWFTLAGGVAANRLAAWNGSAWAPVGSGPGSSFTAQSTLAFCDTDGDGPLPRQLVSAGMFPNITNGIGRWDGSAWHPIGGGMNLSVGDLVEFDPDGAGPRPSSLIAGGDFGMVDNVQTLYVATWNGSAWGPLGGGTNGTVRTMLVHDLDGNGPQPARLIAGGSFTYAGGAPANRVAKWDGTSWSPIGAGVNGTVLDLAELDVDGVGPEPAQLYAAVSWSGPNQTSLFQVMRWDGAIWSPLQPPADRQIETMTVLDSDGGGPLPPRLVISGQFTRIGSLASAYVVAYGAPDDCTTISACGPADVASAGAASGPDGLLDNNDFIVFINLFFANDTAADVGTAGGLVGSDGYFDNNDFIAFINQFFDGC